MSRSGHYLYNVGSFNIIDLELLFELLSRMRTNLPEFVGRKFLRLKASQIEANN